MENFSPDQALPHVSLSALYFAAQASQETVGGEISATSLSCLLGTVEISWQFPWLKEEGCHSSKSFILECSRLLHNYATSFAETSQMLSTHEVCWGLKCTITSLGSIQIINFILIISRGNVAYVASNFILFASIMFFNFEEALPSFISSLFFWQKCMNIIWCWALTKWFCHVCILRTVMEQSKETLRNFKNQCS